MSHTGITQRDIEQFIYFEARLLDAKRFDEWNDLFLEDGIYWIPASRDQPDPLNWVSHAYDDKLLRDLRISRLANPRNFTQNPPSRCHHLLQLPQVEAFDEEAQRYRVRTEFLYTESQGDTVHSLVGSYVHELRGVDGQLRIQQKKVELLLCDQPLPSIQLFV